MRSVVKPSTKVWAAQIFAAAKHGAQLYVAHVPYSVHLAQVDGVLLRFDILDEDLRTAAICHDVLEDTDCTYAALEAAIGTRAAKAVQAVSESKGGTRAARHAVTYPIIAKNPDAIIVKLADRIANMEAGGKNAMYVEEFTDFWTALYQPDSPPVVAEMWAYLLALFLYAKHAQELLQELRAS